jgi:predicted dehydrogenase
MNRRHFLATSAFAGTWSLMTPFARAEGANSTLRVAVIGLNGRGSNHVEEMMKAKGATLVALCDCDSEVLGKMKDKVEKAGGKVATFTDFRKLLASPDIDAVTIATPNHTHCLIATTAAAHGKHVYVEKPVSHNVWEGRVLAEAQKKHQVIIQHGFQRRSETAWEEAFAWLAAGNLGKLKLARGLCYKPRPSIGKVAEAKKPPASVDYDLWSGTREMLPVMREKFHYDWHWQFPYGNGDLGNQGPHQLDVCRWAVGDPMHLPPVVLSCGDRFAHKDDGQWANTQLVFLGYEPVPILFEVRGLPSKNLDYKSGMDRYQGQEIGNVLEYEGGTLVGGHSADCKALDKDGKTLKEFKGGKSHFQTWVDAVHSGKQDPMRRVENGHVSSALAHLGNISWRTGEIAPVATIREQLAHPAATEALDRMTAHLLANGIDVKDRGFTLGKKLTIAPGEEKFSGPNAEAGNALLKDPYRKPFELA